MEKDKTPKKPFPPQRSTLGERMNDTSTIAVKRDGKWVWLDNGEEVKNPPVESDKKEKFGEFYKPSDK
jgi:hypothetical protein